ncbi:MAG: hypothetical protein C7B44_01010 [Sulfobacillus thermosulfidooxidans]|nr:MAG: hypothetical protein C7B44_01010 [Sulfobacillus thermosulfidooxidans]
MMRSTGDTDKEAAFRLRGFRRAGQLFRLLGKIRPVFKLPQELFTDQLDAPVEIVRDDVGVPHIQAATMKDALFVQGFIHGRERAFQMDISRRLPLGQLAEILGPQALSYDRFMRSLNVNHWAEQAPSTWSDNTREYVAAYVDGVNYAFKSQPLPPEYRFLQVPLRPWTVHDTNAIIYQLAWTLNSIWHSKWVYDALDDDDDVKEWLFGALGVEIPTIVPGTGSYEPWIPATGAGSNNWVVDGTRTESGGPLLANDPHLMPQLPSIWYEMFVEGGALHVFGASLPGAPGIIIGQNQDIAWGVTNVDPDVQDLYRLHLEPGTTRYVVDGETLSLTERVETLHVRGGVDETLSCYDSVWGPVIYKESDQAIALAWTAFQPLPMVQAVLRLDRAHDWETFNTALAEWWVPAQNFVYADRAGHIGYIAAGRIPTRSGGPWRGIVDGHDGRFRWTGWVEWTEMPRLFDPPQGFIVTANNPVTGQDAATVLFGRYSLGARANRIQELIQRQPRHNAESFKAIQQDIYSGPLLALAQKLLREDVPQEWRTILEDFDGHARASSPAPTLLYFFALSGVPPLVRERLNQPFFPNQKPRVPGSHPFPETLWELLGERLIPALLAHWSQIDLALAVERTQMALSQTLGDVDHWAWGNVHQARLYHPLAEVKILAPLFGRQSMRMPGDLYSPLQAAFPLDPRLPWPRWVSFMPSYRQIMDVKTPVESLAVHLTGQSGHPLSSHYDNLMGAYVAGDYYPLGPGMMTHLWFMMRHED